MPSPTRFFQTPEAFLAAVPRPKVLCFTNGCFDLIHPGHVQYLADARAAILLGLRSVDAVVRFDEETPLDLIRALQPDVLVKGGDYTPETVVGREVVEGRGGKLVLIPFLPGHSTSRIEARIRSGRGVTLE